MKRICFGGGTKLGLLLIIVVAMLVQPWRPADASEPVTVEWAGLTVGIVERRCVTEKAW